MKKLAKNQELCIACHNCENVCSKTYFKEEKVELAALRIIESVDSGDKMITCTQCGECIVICPADAIYRDNKGVVRIKKSLCVGCFSCVGFCPEVAMFQYGENTEPFKCIACGICTRACPTGAIFLED